MQVGKDGAVSEDRKEGHRQRAMEAMERNWKKTIDQFIITKAKEPGASWNSKTAVVDSLSTYGINGYLNGILINLATEGLESGYIMAHINGLDISVEDYATNGMYAPLMTETEPGKAYMGNERLSGFNPGEVYKGSAKEERKILIKQAKDQYAIGKVFPLAENGESVAPGIDDRAFEFKTGESLRLELDPHKQNEDYLRDPSVHSLNVLKRENQQ